MEEGDMTRKLIAALVVMLTLGACVRTNVQSASTLADEGLTVVGVGRVDAKPDTIVVSFRVATTRFKAAEALETTSRISKKLVASLKANGIAEDDIQTTSFTLTEERGARYRKTGKQISAQDFRVKIRDLDQVATIIQRAVEDGENRVTIAQLSLAVDDPYAVRDEARGLAIADAQRRAEAMATAGGLELGSVVSVQEDAGYNPYRYGGSDDLALRVIPQAIPMPAIADVADFLPQIEIGTREVEVRVRVRFTLGT